MYLNFSTSKKSILVKIQNHYQHLYYKFCRLRIEILKRQKNTNQNFTSLCLITARRQTYKLYSIKSRFVPGSRFFGFTIPSDWKPAKLRYQNNPEQKCWKKCKICILILVISCIFRQWRCFLTDTTSEQDSYFFTNQYFWNTILTLHPRMHPEQSNLPLDLAAVLYPRSDNKKTASLRFSDILSFYYSTKLDKMYIKYHGRITNETNAPCDINISL